MNAKTKNLVINISIIVVTFAILIAGICLLAIFGEYWLGYRITIIGAFSLITVSIGYRILRKSLRQDKDQNNR